MFGSINTDPAYTFTQEDRQVKIDRLKLLSNYFGESGVQQKGQINSVIKKPSDEVTVDSIKKDENDEELEELKEGATELFDDEEQEDGFGLMYDGKASSITVSFDSLAAAIGSPNDKVTKEQLIALLQSLSSESSENPDAAKEATFVKNLIAKFDTISGGEKYITSFNGVNEPQDYTTVTSAQLTHPIDIRI